MKHIITLRTKEITKLIKQIYFIPKEKERVFYLALKEGKVSFITSPCTFLKWVERDLKEDFEEVLYFCDFFNDSFSHEALFFKKDLKEKEEWQIFHGVEKLIFKSEGKEIILPLKKEKDFHMYKAFRNMITNHKKHPCYIKSTILTEDEQEENNFYWDTTAGELKEFLKHLKNVSELALNKVKKENPNFYIIPEREEKLFIFKQEETIFYSFEGYREILIQGKLPFLQGFPLKEEGLFFNLSELKKFLRLKNKNNKIEFMLQKPSLYSNNKTHYLITLCQKDCLINVLGCDKHALLKKDYCLKEEEIIREKEDLEKPPLEESFEEEKGELALNITKDNFLKGIINISSTCERNYSQRELGLTKGKEENTLLFVSGSDVLFSFDTQETIFIYDKLDMFISWDKVFLEKLSKVKEGEIRFYFSKEENHLIAKCGSFSHKLKKKKNLKVSHFIKSVEPIKDLGISFNIEIEPLKVFLEEIKNKVKIKRNSFYLLQIEKNSFSLWENYSKEILREPLGFIFKGLPETERAGFSFKRLYTLIKGMKGNQTFRLVESCYEGKYWQIQEGNTLKMTIFKEIIGEKTIKAS